MAFEVAKEMTFSLKKIHSESIEESVYEKCYILEIRMVDRYAREYIRTFVQL